MGDASESSVTRILNDERLDTHERVRLLLPLVYDELLSMARRKMGSERVDHTLEPTVLVNEAYLRLVPDGAPQWAGRAHFFAAAAEAMRRILIDHARKKKRRKRGGEAGRVDLDLNWKAETASSDFLVDLSEALDRFVMVDAPKAQLVMLRYFAGMTLTEAAEQMGISRATAARHWAYARAWLFDAMTRGDGSGDSQNQ